MSNTLRFHLSTRRLVITLAVLAAAFVLLPLTLLAQTNLPPYRPVMVDTNGALVSPTGSTFYAANPATAISLASGEVAINGGGIFFSGQTNMLSLDGAVLRLLTASGNALPHYILASSNLVVIDTGAEDFRVQNDLHSIVLNRTTGNLELDGSNILDRVSPEWVQNATGNVNMAGFSVTNTASIGIVGGTTISSGAVASASTLSIQGVPLRLAYALSNITTWVVASGAGDAGANGTFAWAGSQYSNNVTGATITNYAANNWILNLPWLDSAYVSLNGTTGTWYETGGTSPAPSVVSASTDIFNLVPTNPPANGQVLTARGMNTVWETPAAGGGASATNIMLPLTLSPASPVALWAGNGPLQQVVTTGTTTFVFWTNAVGTDASMTLKVYNPSIYSIQWATSTAVRLKWVSGATPVMKTNAAFHDFYFTLSSQTGVLYVTGAMNPEQGP